MKINVPEIAREIVAKRLAVTTTVTSVLAVLVADDVIPVAWSKLGVTYLAVGLNVLGVIVGAVWARSGVTPVNSPQLPTQTADVVNVPPSAYAALAAGEAIHPTSEAPNAAP